MEIIDDIEYFTTKEVSQKCSIEEYKILNYVRLFFDELEIKKISKGKKFYYLFSQSDIDKFVEYRNNIRRGAPVYVNNKQDVSLSTLYKRAERYRKRGDEYHFNLTVLEIQKIRGIK